MAQVNNKAVKRLQKELKKLKKNPMPNADAEPNGKNMLEWTAKIKGPADGPYKDGKFKVLIVFSDDYPMKAPELKFLTKVYHPSVKKDDGTVCPEVIGKDWAPTLNIMFILETLVLMLKEPTAESPLEPEIAGQLVEDKKKFEKTARQWTQKHAKKW